MIKKYIQRIVDDSLDDLKSRLFKQKKQDSGSLYDSWFKSIYDGWGYTPSLEEQLDDSKKKLNKLENKFNVLLKHFDIEYVEITEKNGDTTTTEMYRKIKKVVKEKEIIED